ncbi:putative leucine-rich repeat-containing protein DDB_G0290503 [Mytilus edulis]|uniref:putative leucine-rich repeat-containing protein DDB_G0290503 n=1 Tax=Mytilus edulis TaxID=6550 RepID=UPI0039EE4029
MDELSSEDQQIIRRCLDTIVSVVVDVQIGKFNVRRTKHPEGTIDKASVEAISECHNYSKRYEEENVNNKNDNPPSISNISEEAEQTKKPYNTRYKKKKQCSCGLANTNQQTNMPDPIDLTKLSSTNTFVPYQIKWKSPTCQDVGICMCQTTDEVEKQYTPGTTEKDGACSLGEKLKSSGKRSSLLPYLVNQKSEERGLSLLEEEDTQILHYPWLRYTCRSQIREITTSENNLGYSVVQERGIQTMYADLPTDDEGEDERTSVYPMESDIRSTAISVLMEEGEEENNKSQFSFEDQKMNYSNASDDGGEEMEISEVNISCSDEEWTQHPIKIEYVNGENIVVDSAEICRSKLNSGIILMEPNPDDWTNLKHDYEYSTTLVNAYNSITKSDERVEQNTNNEKYLSDNQIPQHEFIDKNRGKENEISNAMIEQGCQTVLNETTTSDEETDFKDVYESENQVQTYHLNQIKLGCEKKPQDMSCIDDIKSCASGQTDDSEKMKIYTAVPIDDILKISDSKMLSSNLSDPRNDFPNINMKKRTLTETQKCFEESKNLKNKLPGKTLQTTEPVKTLQNTEPAKTMQTTENNFKNILPTKTLQTTESNEINLVPIPVFRVTLTGDNYKYDYEQVGTEMPSATNEKALPDIPIEEENLMSIVDHQNETQIDSPEDTEEFPENPCKGEELTNKFICKLYKECKGREGAVKILHHCVCSVLNICIERSTVNPISLQMKAKKVVEKCRRLKNNTSRSAEFEAFENDLFILPRKKTETKNKVKLEIEGLKDEINNLLSLNEKLKKRQRIAIIKKKRLYQRMNKKNALIEKLSKKLKTVRKIAESRAQELFETTKKLYEKKKTSDSGIQKLRNLKSVESQTNMCLITLPKTLKHKETQCNTAKNDVLALSSQLHYWQCRAVLKTCQFDDVRPEVIVTNKSKTETSGSNSNQ